MFEDEIADWNWIRNDSCCYCPPGCRLACWAGSLGGLSRDDVSHNLSGDASERYKNRMMMIWGRCDGMGMGWSLGRVAQLFLSGSVGKGRFHATHFLHITYQFVFRIRNLELLLRGINAFVGFEKIV